MGLNEVDDYFRKDTELQNYTTLYYITHHFPLITLKVKLLLFFSCMFSETYLNLTGKEYRILDTRSKLQIIIDCSVLLSQESILNKRLKIKDLSSLEFHARRLTHVLHTNRYRLLNHPNQIE